MVSSNAVQPPLMRPTMTIEETASVLGIGRTSAFAAVRRGEIPTIRIGKRLVVPTAPIRRLLGLGELDVVDGVG